MFSYLARPAGSFGNRLMPPGTVKQHTDKTSLSNGMLTSTKTPNADTKATVADDIDNLIPKSIDEEEIMLRKALELSLKQTNENVSKP
jgi:hypothetical protein